MSGEWQNSSAERGQYEEALGAALLDEFGPHLVALLVFFEPEGTDPDVELAEPHAVYSGFVVSVRDQWYWVTAGHVFTDIERVRTHGYRIQSAGLLDNTKHMDGYIPIHFDSLPKAHIDEDGDIDVGVMQLARNAVDLLVANDVRTLNVENVAHQNHQHEHYALVGVPGESVSLFPGEHSDILQMAPVVIPLRRLDDEPAPSGLRRLVFQAGPELPTIEGKPIQSIKGMSGGLIVALRFEPEASYVAFAIQSAWSQSTRQLKAMPLHPVITLIANPTLE